MTEPSVDPPTRAVGRRWMPLWVLAFVAAWPVHGYAEGILVLGALVAIIGFGARRLGGEKMFNHRAWALMGVLFVAYWLSQLLSAPGALDPSRAFKEALLDLRYLPFLWLTVAAVTGRRGRQVTFTGLAVIVLIWSVDALLEAVSGTSVLFWGIDQLKLLTSGRPMCTLEQVAAADRISGVFGPCNFKLGPVLASLSPFLLFAAGRRWGAPGWGAAAMMVGVVIILAGSRASWITFALVVLLSGRELIGGRKTLVVLLAGVLALGGLSVGVPEVGQRVLMTSKALAGHISDVDSALSGRVRIWSAALCMIAEHPITGVGTRGFRSAFAHCDPAPEQAPMWGEGPALHAHQIVLEILSETGVIGLILWLSAAAMAWQAWRAQPSMRQQARPAMLALVVTVFPFNTHLAFYSTLWGGLTLLLAALYAGSLLGQEEPSRGGGKTWKG